MSSGASLATFARRAFGTRSTLRAPPSASAPSYTPTSRAGRRVLMEPSSTKAGGAATKLKDEAAQANSEYVLEVGAVSKPDGKVSRVLESGEQ